ncbi:ankyrin repeat domain-containing protein [Roseateles sp. YR242]|uniref:ankyrin repeat domain-containing protein n=1 Tax=Roseateles sp. YR242 TaxID=1855305 RepID=UPI0015A70DEB|nr:ankyrin repeat domain-containing protein [Roseateles sp. YR242]
MTARNLIKQHDTSARDLLDPNAPYRLDTTLLRRSFTKIFREGVSLAAGTAGGLLLTYGVVLSTRYLKQLLQLAMPQIGVSDAVVATFLASTNADMASLTTAMKTFKEYSSHLRTTVASSRPTALEDLRQAHAELLRMHDKTIKGMPRARRSVFNIVNGRIKTLWRQDIDAGAKPSASEVGHLMQTLELLIKSFESSLFVPRNIWGFDVGDLETGRKLRTATKEICANVDRDGVDAVEKFMSIHRLMTAGNWKPSTDNKGSSDMNVLVLVGEPGTGKSFVSRRISEALNCAKRAKGEAGCDEVEVLFSDLLQHLGPAEKKAAEDKEATIQSPSERFNTFEKLIHIRPGSIVRIEEGDLVGPVESGGDGSAGAQPTAHQYLDEIKRKMDHTGFGRFELAGAPEGVVFLIDLRRVSFIITTNNVPNDAGIFRRFGIAYCNRTPENKRDDIAVDTASYVLNELLKRNFERSLTAEEQDSIRGQLAGVLSHIVQQGSDDVSPQMMQVVIGDVAREMAALRALGENEPLARVIPSGDPMDPTTWGPSINLDAQAILRINRMFTKHRPPDWVKSLLFDAKNALLERTHNAPLPDVAHHMQIAQTDSRLNRREAMRYVVEAVKQQWASELDHRPADIRKTADLLMEYATAGLIHISPDPAGRPFPFNVMRPEMCINLFDTVMRIPTRHKNLSHWQKSGDPNARLAVEEKIVRLQQRFEGTTDGGTSVAKFAQRAVDNTLPFNNDAGKRRVQRATLALSGPPETSCGEKAAQIFSDLGFQVLKLTLLEYANLFTSNAANQGYFASTDDKQPSIDLNALAGPLKPLLQGEFYNCGIILSDVDLSKPDQMRQARKYLSTEADNPVLRLAQVANCEFQIPLTEIPVILTTTEPITDGALSMYLEQTHVARSSEAERRSQVQRTVNAEVRRLELLDLPLAERSGIRQTINQMMWYCLQLNLKRDKGAEPLLKAVSSLFSELSVAARRRVMAQPNDEASGTLATEEASLPQDLDLTWPEVPREALQADLVAVLEREFSLYSVIKEERGRKDPFEEFLIEPIGMPFRPDGERDASPMSDAASRELSGRIAEAIEQLKGASPEVLDRAAAEARLQAEIASGRQTTISNWATKRLPKFHGAASSGDVATLSAMLNQLTNPDRAGADGDTAVHLSTRHAQQAALTTLLAHPNVRKSLTALNGEGHNPVHLAAANGLTPMLKLLLASSRTRDDLEFDINQRDGLGQTALMIAAAVGNTEAVQLLIDHPDSDRQAVDDQSMTAAQHAAAGGHKAALEALLQGETPTESTATKLAVVAFNSGHSVLGRSLLNMHVTEKS